VTEDQSTAEVRYAHYARRYPAAAPLAQSAERLHGKYPARIAVLARKNAVHPRPVWTQLDALRIAFRECRNVTQVTASNEGLAPTERASGHGACRISYHLK
jgi:hypothetical protein